MLTEYAGLPVPAKPAVALTFTPLQGGIPITVNGKIIGAIGVSGNTPQEDEDIAKAGAASAEAAIAAQ